MLILSILAFFVVIFLLASITVTVAWMAFLKTRRKNPTPRGADPAGPDAAPAGTRERSTSLRCSAANVSARSTSGTALLARFDFIEILQARIAQAELDWSVGRVTLAMLLCGTVALLISAEIRRGVGRAAGRRAGGLRALRLYPARRRDKRFLKFRENFPGRARFAGARAARRLSAFGRHGDDLQRDRCRRSRSKCARPRPKRTWAWDGRARSKIWAAGSRCWK